MVKNGFCKGIAFAGNILTDVVKTVDCYPEIGMLANIKNVSRSVGGSVPNTAINLAKMNGGIPLSAIGRIGNDDYGRYVVSELNRYGIGTSMVSVSDTAPTSFSDVMSMPSGERTFFHARGANAEFGPEHIDVSKLDCDIFHIGYILLLDRLDSADDEYGTVMARLLHDVQSTGIKTSVDVVSDSTADYHKMIVPALKYSNYAIMNEIESCSIWGLCPVTADGKPDIKNIRLTMEKMAECGVKDKIIVHCKAAGFCLDVPSGTFTQVPSLKIPSKMIKGSVGAGDSYCAGSLCGIYEGKTDREILEFASAAAACNLFAENSVDGMLSEIEIAKVAAKFGRLEP